MQICEKASTSVHENCLMRAFYFAWGDTHNDTDKATSTHNA